MDSDETITILKYRNLFFFVLTACLLCVDTQNGLSIHSLTAAILTSFLLSWPTSFLLNKICRGCQIVIGECFIVLCVVDCYCQIYFNSPITPQILSNILLSDARETSEFIQFFLKLHVILKWRIFCLLLLSLFLPVCIICSKCQLKESNIKSRLLFVVIVVFCAFIETPTTYRFSKLFFQNKMEDMEGLIFRHYHEEVPTPLHRVVFAYYCSTRSRHTLEEIKNVTYNAEIDNCSYMSSHIVLIIGESFNKYHSSLYGYDLPTAPMQQKRKENGEMFVFTDVVSPWNITSNVFLEMFSLWENGNERDIATFPMFPILFRRAGYSVDFYSNQYLLKGFRKGSTNQTGHFFLADNQFSDSLFSYRNIKSSKYDMGLVWQVKNDKENKGFAANTLDIIHLIGQHFDYSMRYPQEMGFFSIEDYSNRLIDDEAKQIVMHYDNAVRYNDIVIDSLLAIYEDEDAVVIYVSDHGEEVYDDQPVSGRLFQKPTALQAKNEYEVPMWIWCSYIFRDRHPEIVDEIKKSVNKPFMTDGLPQILLYLASITCKWSNEKYVLLNSEYECKPRIIGGNTDYDKLLKIRIH